MLVPPTSARKPSSRQAEPDALLEGMKRKGFRARGKAAYPKGGGFSLAAALFSTWGIR